MVEALHKCVLKGSQTIKGLLKVITIKVIPDCIKSYYWFDFLKKKEETSVSVNWLLVQLRHGIGRRSQIILGLPEMSVSAGQ